MTTELSGTNNSAPTDSRLTDKEFVMDLLRGLPDDVTICDIAQKLEFVAAVRQGLANLDSGRSVSIQQIERDLASWSVTVGHKHRGERKARSKRSSNAAKKKAGDSLKSPAPRTKA